MTPLRSSALHRLRWLLLLLLVFAAALLWPTLRATLQATAVLIQLQGRPVPHWLAPVASQPVAQHAVALRTPGGAIPAELYTPAAHPHVPGIVLVPGVHYLGIQEPRLVAFARSLAACGFQVLTPQLPGSADYHIAPDDISAIASSIGWLHNVSRRRVALVGLSFSGGLSLMAAAQPSVANDLSVVLSVGAHDNLYRVAMFYATGADPLPSGDVERTSPNPYGPWVIEYQHLDDFLPAADVPILRPILRARLYNNAALEATLAARLTPAQKSEYDALVAVPATTLAESNARHIAEMAAVSPHAHLTGLRGPVYLLHGRGDTLIPFAESDWLAADLPPGALQEQLVTPLLGHVSANTTHPGLWQQFRLVRLLAQVLQHARHA